ncbi:M28 family peptidase [Labilibacter sediminis]|nr:M28 family peptidase [Labilibacter sediminis]
MEFYKRIWILVFLFCFRLLNGQVTESDLKKHVEILASPEFEGRGIRNAGHKKAELYILRQLNYARLKPGNQESFRQEFSFKNVLVTPPFNHHIVIQGDTLINFLDYVSVRTNSAKSKEIVLYAAVDADKIKTKKDEEERKAILIDDVDEQILNTLVMKGFNYIITPVSSDEEFLRLKEINESGIIQDISDANLFLIPSREYDMYYLHPKVYTELKHQLKIKQKKAFQKVGNIELPVKKKEINANPSNLLALIPGENADSTIVISAHYDHIGVINNQVYLGANDNASGTAGVLAVAKELQKYANKNGLPKYNILFAFFSCEEVGLKGSQFYVENPASPLNSTIANINLDMIGNEDEQHKSNPNFIYAYGPKGKSEFLMHKIDSINQESNFLTLDFFENNMQVGNKFLRLSDQANFIKNDIPALFLFNGLSPHYHKVSDRPDKLDYTKMKNVCNLLVALIKDMAYDL